MKTVVPALLFLAFGLDTSCTVARAGTPVASIAKAVFALIR